MSVAVTTGDAMTPGLCGARTRGGAFCRRPAGWGTSHLHVGRCKLHGGSTPNHVANARAKLAALVDPAVAELQRLLGDETVPDHVKLATARDILDRNGLVPPKRIEYSGPDGGPIPVEVRQAELLDRIRQVRSGTIIDTTLSEDE